MSLLQRVWAALGAVAMTILAIVGIAGWYAERRRAKALTGSAVDLAKQNADRAKAQAASSVAAVDEKAQGDQNAAVSDGPSGLACRIAAKR